MQQHHPLQPSSSNHSPAIVTTEQIQKCLEENKNLIMAIMEHKNLGNFQECAQLQAILQRNLMNLAAIADAQPPTPQMPNASQVMQMPQGLTPQQANQFMQQASGGGGGQKMPFQLNPQQQQLLYYQQQQQLQAQMGLRQGAQGGFFGMQSAMMGNHGGDQVGSESALGGDGRGFLRDNSGF